MTEPVELRPLHFLSLKATGECQVKVSDLKDLLDKCEPEDYLVFPSYDIRGGVDLTVARLLTVPEKVARLAVTRDTWLAEAKLKQDLIDKLIEES